MTTNDIERLLRQPAHDEPAILPPLVLPHETGTGGLRDRSLDTALGFGRMTFTMRMAIAALLLAAALAGALASGTLRLEQLNAPLSDHGTFTGNGITLSYPPSWDRITPLSGLDDGSSVALIVSSAGVNGCSADQLGTHTPPPASLGTDGSYYLGNQEGQIYALGDRIYACVLEKPMAPGEVRVVVSQSAPQRIQVGPFGDFEESFLDPSFDAGALFVPGEGNGFTEEVGGMPARLVTRDHSAMPGADEVRAWLVATPDAPGSLWYVVAALKGPDLESRRTAADAMARSLAFSSLPPVLTPDGRDAALAKAIDSRDREMRFYPGSRMLGCFPRTPGSAAATITEGRDGPLAAPLAVTCTTTVESTGIRQWRATLVVEWAATDGVPAGRWGRELLFDGDGQVTSDGSLFADDFEVVFPGSWQEAPAAGRVPVLQPGDLIRVVGPNLQRGYVNLPLEGGGPSNDRLDASGGSLLTIVEGPVRDDGLDWYRADGGYELGWFVPSAGGTPLVELAEPACPGAVRTVEDLVYRRALELRLCLGSREVTLGPGQIAPRPDLGGDPTPGDPAWLATEPTLALFGSGGTDGIDAGLRVALAPGVVEPAPGSWVTVRGHYDDPAAATCSWTYPEGSGVQAEPPEVQHRRCAERFVITSIEPADAP